MFKPGWIGPTVGTWAAPFSSIIPPTGSRKRSRWGYGLTVDTEHFASVYLVAHGVAKVFIAWGLFREKLWAFPTAFVVFGLLILYQLYRFAHTHSPTLAFLIAVDVAVCYLIWREYGFRREGVESG